MCASPVVSTRSYQADRVGRPSPDHSLIPPCQAACPLHMDIREYVDLVAQGKILEALQVIRSGNPFPSICAYVCTHPCETACRRAQVDKPIAIRALKRFALEFGGDRLVQAEAETTHSEKVGIVGSGPAGIGLRLLPEETRLPGDGLRGTFRGRGHAPDGHPPSTAFPAPCSTQKSRD